MPDTLVRGVPTLPLAGHGSIDFARPDIGGVARSPIGYAYDVPRPWRK